MQVRRREVELREVAIITERDTGRRRWRPREGGTSETRWQTAKRERLQLLEHLADRR